MGAVCPCFEGVAPQSAERQQSKTKPRKVAEAEQPPPLPVSKELPSAGSLPGANKLPGASTLPGTGRLSSTATTGALAATKTLVPAATNCNQMDFRFGGTVATPSNLSSSRALQPIGELQTDPSEAAATASNDGAPSRTLGIDSFLDIFSNSNSAWCPGIVAGVDGASILVAYQAPSNSPTEPNISTKMLPMDSPEIRRPLDNGPWLGAVVDVYSNSNQAWCKGVIQKIDKSVATVAYFYPNAAAGSDPAFKNLPLGDNDLRLPGAEYATAAVQAVGGELFVPGCQVEVYSNSVQVWCPGMVRGVQAGVISVEFYYPDMDPRAEPPVLKELPMGHQDIRFVKARGPAENGVYVDPNVDLLDFAIGRPIQVYSHSRQAWITGVIHEVSDGNVTAIFRYPDSEEQVQKVLPAGHRDFRLLAAPS